MRRHGLVTLVVCLVWLTQLQAGLNDWEKTQWAKTDPTGRMAIIQTIHATGRSADAAQALQTILTDDPDDQTVALMGYGLRSPARQAMLADPITQAALRKFLDRFEQALAKLRQDSAYVDSVINEITGDVDGRQRARERCLHLGEYAVPALVKVMLGTQDKQLEVYVHSTLVTLGRRATRPLSAAVWVEDPVKAVAICRALGEIGDELAVGSLSDLAGRSDKSERVRSAAGESLNAILTRPNCPIPPQDSAARYYYLLADAFLHRASWTLSTLPPGTDLPVWSWSETDQTITAQVVSEGLYGPEMAEEFCSLGLRSDETDLPLRGLLLSSYFAQTVELAGKLDQESRRRMSLAILAGGEEALYLALSKALTDTDPGIAVLACQELQELSAGQGIPADRGTAATNPLLSALGSDNPVVRFAAARAVVKLAPTRQDSASFENMDRVLPALAWGLSYQYPARPILVAADSGEVTGTYRELLMDLGHPMLEALDVETLLRQAGSQPKPAAVIIQEDMLSVLDQLRVQLGDATPVLVMVTPEKYPRAEVGYVQEEGWPGVVTTRPSRKHLGLALTRAFGTDQSAPLARLIPEMAQKAAESLAAIDTASTPLMMDQVVPALVQALAQESDAVRVPTLMALGNVALPETTQDILLVAVDKNNSKPVRIAALDALTRIFHKLDPVGPDVFRLLVPVTAEDDEEIALAAARAVATAKFDPSQYTDLALKKRVTELKAGQQ